MSPYRISPSPDNHPKVWVEVKLGYAILRRMASEVASAATAQNASTIIAGNTAALIQPPFALALHCKMPELRP